MNGEELEECPICSGTGWLREHRCPTCAGHGTVPVEPDGENEDEAKAELERLYRQAAKDVWAEDGKIIVDDEAKVDSPFEDERRGAYVQAWVWVDGPAEDDPEDEEREEDEEA